MKDTTMRALTIVELPSGGFILLGGKTDICYMNPNEGPVSVCAKLGATYDYPNSTETLPGAVRAFFDKPASVEE